VNGYHIVRIDTALGEEFREAAELSWLLIFVSIQPDASSCPFEERRYTITILPFDLNFFNTNANPVTYFRTDAKR